MVPSSRKEDDLILEIIILFTKNEAFRSRNNIEELGFRYQVDIYEESFASISSHASIYSNAFREVFSCCCTSRGTSYDSTI